MSGRIPLTGAEQRRWELMKGMLQLAVPLWLKQARRWPEAKIVARARECGDAIAEHGDVLMFKGKKADNTRHAFNRLAEGIACGLLLADGGMEFLGVRWYLDGGQLRVGPVYIAGPPAG